MTTGTIGIVAAAAMCVGALGPWARTPVISFSGWAGIGLPLVVLAFVALAIEVLHVFVPRRAWLVLCILVGAVNLICAIILGLLESVLSRAGSLLAFLVARGAHEDVLSSHPVTLGWGIPLLGLSAFVLMVVSIAGLFGRFSQPAIPQAIGSHFRHEQAPTVADGSSTVGPSDDELFNTR